VNKIDKTPGSHGTYILSGKQIIHKINKILNVSHVDRCQERKQGMETGSVGAE
jgi:hypothetical protein